ncbi:MAG: carbohydrate ABC transporter permease [Oscillospiraceae bacterium]
MAKIKKKKVAQEFTGIIGAIDYKRTGVKIFYWAMYTLCIICCLICILPPIWIMLSSFSDVKDLLAIPPSIFPKSFHPEKLIEAWNKLNFLQYYSNTFVMVIGDLLFAIFINGLAGYVISRLKPKGGTLVLTLILWTMMMPNSLNMIPLYGTFLDFPLFHVNLTNTYWPMWLMSGANPFNILMFKSFFDGIPSAYIEAARIDGCTNLGIFAKIILPLSKPIIMVVSIFTVTASWDNFLWPYLILKDEGLYTVAVKIFAMKSAGFPLDLHLMALLFAILPPLILFVFFQKHIMTGFALGGVKG